MSEISLAEAEGKLAELVERARHGETIEITEDGQAIVCLVRADSSWDPTDIEQMKAFTDSLPPDPEQVATWMRKFRDDDRY